MAFVTALPVPRRFDAIMKEVDKLSQYTATHTDTDAPKVKKLVF